MQILLIDYQFKILLIGNSGAGKSCVLMRFTDNLFVNSFYNTIGVDYKAKTIQYEKKKIKLQIWDTAGQERFKTITSSYYKGAHGIAIIYDISDRNSFENVREWMNQIESFAREDVKKILVGNKSDLNDKRVIQFDEGLNLGQKQQVQSYKIKSCCQK
ncbi:Ras-related protein ric1, putative [Ichthyophthirius multifiliis]|uniref:Ras-related protein ric1, putative n=1 Tax=Ichthyophthirius multifiliis TaxID=5932 RepID=G0QZA8_ICHMU|nr:Ras-related protein ric1, putative [Ichthyophthirius multifiliis]EGR29448.1 Ras-related protein ric1, putative [Ichthyophthirius multifiliis]|eukprot:XP_004030684.1 Ras-related protein ric1, putative [Ichthyophthirius multifiliis]